MKTAVHTSVYGSFWQNVREAGEATKERPTNLRPITEAAEAGITCEAWFMDPGNGASGYFDQSTGEQVVTTPEQEPRWRRCRRWGTDRRGGHFVCQTHRWGELWVAP